MIKEILEKLKTNSDVDNETYTMDTNHLYNSEIYTMTTDKQMIKIAKQENISYKLINNSWFELKGSRKGLLVLANYFGYDESDALKHLKLKAKR